MMKCQISPKLQAHSGPVEQLRNEFNFRRGYYFDKWYTLRLEAKIVVDMRGV